MRTNEAEVLRNLPAQVSLSDAAIRPKGYNLTSLAWALTGLERSKEKDALRAMQSQRRLLQKYRSGSVNPSLEAALDLSRLLGGEASDYRAPDLPPAADWRILIERRLSEIEGAVADLRPLLEELASPRRRRS